MPFIEIKTDPIDSHEQKSFILIFINITPKLANIIFDPTKAFGLTPPIYQ